MFLSMDTTQATSLRCMLSQPCRLNLLLHPGTLLRSRNRGTVFGCSPIALARTFPAIPRGESFIFEQHHDIGVLSSPRCVISRSLLPSSPGWKASKFSSLSLLIAIIQVCFHVWYTVLLAPRYIYILHGALEAWELPLLDFRAHWSFGGHIFQFIRLFLHCCRLSAVVC